MSTPEHQLEKQLIEKLISLNYIMALIARYSQQTPGKQKMSRDQLVGLIHSDAKFMNEREDIFAAPHQTCGGARDFRTECV